MEILHFNDIYNIDERDDSGAGAARFASLLNQNRQNKPLILFSGDAFSPSDLSTIYKGEQMLEVLVKFNIHVAWIGNHDFDFGLEKLQSLIGRTEITWVMSNMKRNGAPVLGVETHVMTWNDIKLGFIGLGDQEWFDWIEEHHVPGAEFEPFVDCANRLAPKLREQGCQMIIALTHMRSPDDLVLAKQVADVDLILGGHDHLSFSDVVENCPVIKSGSDFREITKINVQLGGNEPLYRNGITMQWEKIFLTKDLEQDPEIATIVDKYLASVEEDGKKVICHIPQDLEARFGFIRCQETPIGNLLADILRFATQSDIAIIHAGTIRLDCELPAGDFTFKNLRSMLPTQDMVLKLRISGQDVLEAVNNGYSKYPALEGRFCIPSGFSVNVHTSQPPESRVRLEDIKIGGEPLDLDRMYTIGVKHFLSVGGDGYLSLKNKEELIALDYGMWLKPVFASYFEMTNPPKLDSIESLEEVEGVKICRLRNDGRINLLP